MDIKNRHEIAKEVFSILEKNYPNYSKETLCNQALLELDRDLKLNAEQIAEKIKPMLKSM